MCVKLIFKALCDHSILITPCFLQIYVKTAEIKDVRVSFFQFHVIPNGMRVSGGDALNIIRAESLTWEQHTEDFGMWTFSFYFTC